METKSTTTQHVISAPKSEPTYLCVKVKRIASPSTDGICQSPTLVPPSAITTLDLADGTIHPSRQGFISVQGSSSAYFIAYPLKKYQPPTYAHTSTALQEETCAFNHKPIKIFIGIHKEVLRGLGVFVVPIAQQKRHCPQYNGDGERQERRQRDRHRSERLQNSENINSQSESAPATVQSARPPICAERGKAQPSLWRICRHRPIKASYSCRLSPARLNMRRQGIRK